MMKGSLYRGIRKIKRKLFSGNNILHNVSKKVGYIFIGTEYGGWPVLTDTPKGSVAYSFGVGRDISFDIGLIDRFGCHVLAFDPTPRSSEWVRRQTLPEKFSFFEIGIAAEDGEASFAPPDNDSYVSFSSTKALASDRRGTISAPVRKVKTVVLENGQEIPEIIKMDVEGFEYEILNDIISDGILPRQLLVEFHHGLYGFSEAQTLNSVAKVMESGYDIFYISEGGREYGFCRSK